MVERGYIFRVGAILFAANEGKGAYVENRAPPWGNKDCEQSKSANMLVVEGSVFCLDVAAECLADNNRAPKRLIGKTLETPCTQIIILM